MSGIGFNLAAAAARAKAEKRINPSRNQHLPGGIGAIFSNSKVFQPRVRW
jgi:hypothetical protein